MKTAVKITIYQTFHKDVTRLQSIYACCTQKYVCEKQRDQTYLQIRYDDACCKSLSKFKGWLCQNGLFGTAVLL